MMVSPSSGGVGEAAFNDMKQHYIKPEIEAIDIAVENMIATSPSISVGDDVESGVTGTRERRGSWGDLWSEE